MFGGFNNSKTVNDLLFNGINICAFVALMQLPPVRGNLVFDQPSRFVPTTHLWRSFSLIILIENMRQQSSTTFDENVIVNIH